MNTQRKVLRRSRDNRMLAGVCGGPLGIFWDQCFLVPAGFLDRTAARRHPRHCHLSDNVDYHPERIRVRSISLKFCNMP